MLIKDEHWPIARLIPISSASGVEAQERRAASALLAVMSAVEEFGRSLLKPLGAPGGRATTYIEVPFKVNDVALRPDGIITVSRGGRTWGALLEVKTGPNEMDADQLALYVDLARELQFDAVVTISNQFVSSSSEYPVNVDRRRLGKMQLRHWSWIDILTEAVVQKEHRGVSDPDQAYILGELIRYLSDPRSGVVAFGSMGSSWTAVRDGARNATLRRADPAVAAVAARWDDLMRFIALELTKDLGRDVRQQLRANERSPASRQQSLQEALAASGRLHATFSIPDAAGDIELCADLRAREIAVSTQLDAPREGKSRGRVSWLLRQLASSPESLRVESRAAHASTTQACTLAEARVSPERLHPEADREIREFILTLARVPGLNRDTGRGSFSESVVNLVKDFYVEVLQEVRAWKPNAPRLSKAEIATSPTERVVEIPALEDAIEAAQQEMEQVQKPSPAQQQAPSDEGGRQ